ncbi:MAG: hypothetical protein GPJ54_10155, partial [Candidatus Heimdallarchaeota archaeon]|nr:hypothetical protein [Candidatus Heimdallarchaeota archaeon]
EDSKITKIFQDMQYDLALLKFNHNCNTKNVFDISLADRLVRHSNNNRKLPKIVEDYLGIQSKIPNKSQKSNWGIRPLTEKQIEYAAYDVMYLPEIYHFFQRKLEATFSYLCLQDYMRKYEPKDYRRKYNVNSMWKVKNVDSRSQNQLFRFKNLLFARDKIGQTLNRPLYWICSEALLLDLASTNYVEGYEIKKFLEKNKAYNRYMNQGFKYLVSALEHQNANVELIEHPEYGESLKTWIPLSESQKRDYYPDPELVLTIKTWQNEVISNLELIPEFMREKGMIGYIASLNISQWKLHIEFPGIPKNLHNLFILDLIQYLETGKSELTQETLNEIQ